MAGKKRASRSMNALKKMNQQKAKEEKERIALAEEAEQKLAQDRKVQEYSKTLSKRTPAVALDGCTDAESSIAIMHFQEEGLDLVGQEGGVVQEEGVVPEGVVLQHMEAIVLEGAVLPQVEVVDAEMDVHAPVEVVGEERDPDEPMEAAGEERVVHAPVEGVGEERDAVGRERVVHAPVEGVDEERDADEPMEAADEERVVHGPDAVIFDVHEAVVLQQP